MKKFYLETFKAHNKATKLWYDGFVKLNHPLQVTEVSEADIIICVGGDGTLLKTVKRLGHLSKPIYGINAGTIGFLMNSITLEELDSKVLDYNSNYKVQSLNTIEGTVHYDGGKIKTVHAFNEVGIGGDMSTWAHFKVQSKSLPKKFKGSGVIISTAQGSTGVNKNNYGVVVPITNKDWVVTGDKTDILLSTVIKAKETIIEVESRQDIKVFVDGASGVIIDKVEKLIVRSGNRVKICFSDFSKFVEKRYRIK